MPRDPPSSSSSPGCKKMAGDVRDNIGEEDELERAHRNMAAGTPGPADIRALVKAELMTADEAVMCDKMLASGGFKRGPKGSTVPTQDAGAGLVGRGINPKPGTRVRPEGIPENWRIGPSRSKGGIKFQDPKNPGNHVRVEQGKPNSQYPHSQGPYVRDVRNGPYRDNQSNVVPKHNASGHAPLDQYRGYQQ